MVSKATAKFIKSLQLKKYRKQHNAFLVEGAKSVLELLNSGRFPTRIIVGTREFLDENSEILNEYEVYEAKDSELASLGNLKSNNAALAVADSINAAEPDWRKVDYALVLDNINDPGNLGTILRIADWYGIHHIVASLQTAELFNSKVINASKGSFLRVNVFYKDLPEFLKNYRRPMIGTFLNGDSVHHFEWPDKGFIIMGNEANGISQEVEKLTDLHVTIPGSGQTESLNVAIATAVICDNWLRSRR